MGHPSPINAMLDPSVLGSILLLLHNFLSPCPSTTPSFYRTPYGFHLSLLSSTNLLSSPAAHISYSYLLIAHPCGPFNHIAQRPVPTPMTILSVKFSHSRQALILDTRISNWTTDLRGDISTARCIKSSLLILIVAVAIRRGCLNNVLSSSTMIKKHFYR